MIPRLALILFVGLMFSASALVAQTRVDELARVLRLTEVATILREEGLRYGQTLETDMLGGDAGQLFRDRIDRIYASDVIARWVRQALDKGLSDTDIAAVIAFFDRPQGQRILSLENSARVAMADPSIEEIARQTYADLADSDDARLAIVSRFIQTNDLLERNVAAALGANYAFLLGLSDGGSDGPGQEDILAEVWAQEDELREETQSWLYGFLLMAYRPLDEAELVAYAEFSATSAGQSLNAALFDGFDGLYRSISYSLGVVVGQAMGSSDI